MPHPITRRDWLQQASLAALSTGALWRSPSLSAQQPVAKGTKRLITRTEQPFNAEPALEQLLASWTTPWESFFVRSHGAVPQLDPATFQVQIDGLVERPQAFTVTELKDRFPTAFVDATLTCAGNRRDEFSAEKKIGGVQWNAGAIGHAQWGGVRLSDVLKFVGVKPEAKHVWFEGGDEIVDMATSTKSPFGGSIALDRALADSVESPGALLALRMNSRPLTAEHGAPVRSLVPGYIGARSVKWLHKITVSDQPSPNRFIARDYKVLYDGGEEEIRAAGPMLEVALNSAIASPAAGSTVKGDRVTVRGYALAGGQPGRLIERVEVSADGGASWTPAQIELPRRQFSWVLWTADVPLTTATPTLVVRATDNAMQTQPERARWNVKGYQNNGWHRVSIQRG